MDPVLLGLLPLREWARAHRPGPPPSESESLSWEFARASPQVPRSQRGKTQIKLWRLRAFPLGGSLTTTHLDQATQAAQGIDRFGPNRGISPSTHGSTLVDGARGRPRSFKSPAGRRRARAAGTLCWVGGPAAARSRLRVGRLLARRDGGEDERPRYIQAAHAPLNAWAAVRCVRPAVGPAGRWRPSPQAKQALGHRASLPGAHRHTTAIATRH